MPIALRHRDDPAPVFPPLSDLAVRREFDAAFMARLQDRTESEMARRFSEGHRAYVAWRDGMPAAWGWVATRSAEIGEVDTTFTVPRGARYLWNFVTRRAHRGRGIYPRLLDAIVRAESAEAERFWVAYAPENHASGSGIRKAGFTRVADLSFDPKGYPVVKAHSPGEGNAAAHMIGLARVEGTVAPCWRCMRSERSTGRTCVSGRCICDYQQPRVACG